MDADVGNSEGNAGSNSSSAIDQRPPIIWRRADWLRWVGTLLLAPIVVAMIGFAVPEEGLDGIVAELFEWAAVIGIVEALLLRRYVPHFGTVRWIIVSLIGAGAAPLVGFFVTLFWLAAVSPLQDAIGPSLPPGLLSPLDFLPATLLGGILVGGLQAGILPDQLPRRGRWIVACGAGAILWFTVAPIVPALLWFRVGIVARATLPVISNLLGTVLYALVSGWAMSRILRAARA